jgi:hypothetical protein
MSSSAGVKLIKISVFLEGVLHLNLTFFAIGERRERERMRHKEKEFDTWKAWVAQLVFYKFRRKRNRDRKTDSKKSRKRQIERQTEIKKY